MGNGQRQIKTWIYEYLETLASSAQTSPQGFISMNPAIDPDGKLYVQYRVPQQKL
jgi:hypothetical protein